MAARRTTSRIQIIRPYGITSLIDSHRQRLTLEEVPAIVDRRRPRVVISLGYEVFEVDPDLAGELARIFSDLAEY